MDRSWFEGLAGPAALLVPVIALHAPAALAPLTLALGAAAWVDIARRRLPVPSYSPVLLAAGSLLAWSACSLFWSIAPAESAGKLAKLAVLGAAIAVVICGAAHVGAARRAVIGRLFFAGWILALTLLALDIALDGFLLKLVHGADDPPSLTLTRYKRGVTVLMLFGWLAAALLIGADKKSAAAISLVAPAIAAFALDARAVGVAAVLGVMFATAMFWTPTLTRRGLPAVAAAVVLAAPLLAAALPRDPTPIANQIPLSALHRIAVWQFATDRIEERPLIGWGLDSASEIPAAATRHPVANWLAPHAATNPAIASALTELKSGPPPLMPLHPHNAALQVWLELGLVGAMLAAIVVYLLGSWLTSRADRAQAALAAGLFVTAFTVAMLSFGIWQGWWLATLALAAAAARLVWSAAD